jgi:lauroyl/myristoyl acyltransferase
LSAPDFVPQTTTAPDSERDLPVPKRWTLHGLNNGWIFGATCRGVRRFPRRVSYALGDIGTWIAWRLMPRTRSAVADNLRALFPDEPSAALERRARVTLRAYARDVVDFLRALQLSPAEARALFDYAPEHERLFETLLAQGRGIILVSGHYGNWELGGVAMRRVFNLPLTVVAMAEANDEVNRLRRDIRDSLGIDTVEVRQSLDTALQIRKRLADNRIVALLMDRHVGRDRVQVNFLNRPAWFLRTPVVMAFLSGAPMVPCFIERSAGGRFRVSPGEPIFVATGVPRDQAIQQAAQQFADQLGARIRQHPDYWYHFYRYWDAQGDSYDQLV